MEAIKRILQHTLNQLEERGQGFICSMIQDTSAIATPEEIKMASKFFKDNRPTETLHKEFYDNKYYHCGSFVWWSYNYEMSDLEEAKMYVEVQAERRRFLEYLISII